MLIANRKWQKIKKSLIFVKLLHLIPRGTLSSELFWILRYLYLFQRYVKFLFFCFFNSAHLFEKIFHKNYGV